jgi:pimeloyl-ACP methyl ester carboxylesterase
MQFQTITANGVDLPYIGKGSGTPVVFVHGSLNDFRSWMMQLNVFAERYRAITYSRRYHYPHKTTNGAARNSIIQHREDLAALFRGLGAAPVHLVGSSYGAYTSLMVVAKYPELVRSLVLGEPPALPLLGDEPDGPMDRQMQVIGMAGALFDRGDAEGAIRTFIDSVIGNGAFDRMPAPVRGMMLDNAPQMNLETHTSVEDYMGYISCEILQTVQTPTLLLTGEISPKLFWQITDVLERCLPNRERTMIPAASHGMHAMNPTAYNQIVLDFLARH